MQIAPLLNVELEGTPPTYAELTALAFGAYGHFTAMQVRSGRTRGLDHHLTRLAQANKELFASDLDGERVRHLIRHALGTTADASVRVQIYGADATVVTVRPPATPQTTTSLLPVDYHRTVPHLKRTNDFGQAFHGRYAESQGYGDALLTLPDGVIAEAGIANVGFFDGHEVIWPDAPMLRGITLQLVEPRLALPARRTTVRLSDLDGFTAAFVTNSRGIVPVTRIGEHSYPVNAGLMAALDDAYESAPLELI